MSPLETLGGINHLSYMALGNLCRKNCGLSTKTNQLHFIEKIIKLRKHDSLVWIWAILLVFQFSNEEMISLFTPTLCPINSIIKRIKPLHSNTCPWIISLLHFNREKRGGGEESRQGAPSQKKEKRRNKWPADTILRAHRTAICASNIIISIITLLLN